MAKRLNINVICEGVETKEQADYLLNEGCAEMQGFYFYKALKVEDFTKLFMESYKINNKQES